MRGGESKDKMKYHYKEEGDMDASSPEELIPMTKPNGDEAHEIMDLRTFHTLRTTYILKQCVPQTKTMGTIHKGIKNP